MPLNLYGSIPPLSESAAEAAACLQNSVLLAGLELGIGGGSPSPGGLECEVENIDPSRDQGRG